jgi:hypothetical protein
MAVTQIPGRRMTSGESFYTDWTSRGGDSLLLRAEVIKLAGAGVKIEIQVQSREEPGDTETAFGPTWPTTTPGLLTIDAEAVLTGLYQAGASTGLDAEVRLKVTCTGGTAATSYCVVRVFSPVFFDNAK